jgi:hypothetical protein
MEPQPKRKRVPGPKSGGTVLVTITERVSRLWRSGEQRSSGPSADVGWQRRLEALEARIEHLETAHEGLQDAVYRRALLEDEKIGQLRRRTDPNQLARDLSRNARNRGL